MAWLLDTNILSELRRLKPEPKVLTFVAGHQLEELYISTVTLATGSHTRYGPCSTSEFCPLLKTSCSGGGLWWKKGESRGTRFRSPTLSSPRPRFTTV